MESVDIKDISGNILLTTKINDGCKRKFTLMKEDYITLKFSLESPIYFKYGDSVDCDFGRFEICDLQKPSYNDSTGGYDYELRLDAYYWKWKNKIFKYTPEAAGQEASWNLTAPLDVQAGIVLRNLKALGYTYNGQDFDFSIDSTVENKSLLMSYDNINILDACFEMAKKWGCECWVTENIIHFGRCEFGDPVDFEIGVNVEEMTRSDSQSAYATRVYAFGSTRNIPANYRPVDESIVVNGVVQKRLMLPVGTPYIDAYPNMRTEEAVEQVVVLDDIFPRRTGTMSDITTHEYTDTIKEEGKPDVVKKWNAYRFKDPGITFSKDYVLAGEELKITFQSGKLNGMTFEVTFNPCDKEGGETPIPEKNEDGSWNPAAQVWEIIRNEDYGRQLPGDVLVPEAGDTYILSGWDSTKIAELGLVDAAEQELKAETEKYVAKSMIDPGTYENRMASDRIYSGDGLHNLYDVGQSVNLVNAAFFESGSRKSRIIGFEYNLDCPYDHPVYTVGETAAYSRIAELEDKIESLTLKGQTYTGGGGSGVYLITSNDTTPATDSNAYSARRALKIFLLKDRPDSTDYLTGFHAGITIGRDRKFLLDIIRTTDGEVTSSDESVYSSLAMDDRFIHKDKPDSTLYPVDFENGLSIGGKRIGDVIRYYDENKPVATDANIYSALMTDQRIDDEIKVLDDKYFRKDRPDTDPYHATFEDGITVYELAELMNLEVDNLATIAQAVVGILRSSRFVDGFAGEGFQIWQDLASGDWNFTIDRLTVRKVLTLYELIIQKIRSVGGMVVVSAANGKVKRVERIGGFYVFTFEDGNQFRADDLMRCQVFSASGLKYYWVRVSSVSGDKAYVPVSEFAGVVPGSGDECVLMGNTSDRRRQSLILISATEDGQPRFDCLDGVKEKNFEGCLKVRVGNLDGISDSRFPAGLQPSGHGLYGNNCFLTGVFVLANGKDVLTMFSIMEGMIKGGISSVRNEINAKDNYLRNASFSADLSDWSSTNRIRVFRVGGKLLGFNHNLYSNKENLAGILNEDGRGVLHLKNSSITQYNSNFARHPEFDEKVKHEQVKVPVLDEEGNPVVDDAGNPLTELQDRVVTDENGNPVMIGIPRRFYISFNYMVRRAGTLTICFRNEFTSGSGEDVRDRFEEYEPIYFEQELYPGDSFRKMEISGKWNGLGDFYLSFSGDLYLDSLVLSDNRLSDMEEKFTLRFEATDKKIQANLDEITRTGATLDAYHSEFLQSAREMKIQFTKDLQNTETRLTEAYESYMDLTACDLTVKFTKDLQDAETRLTESYTSAIEVSAQGLRTEFTAGLEDMDEGITSAYKSYMEITARDLRTGFEEGLTDLSTGLTEAYKSAIKVSADGLRTDFSSSLEDLDGKIDLHASSFHVTAEEINAIVTTTDTINKTIREAGWITTADGNELWASQTTVNGINKRLTTHESSFHVTSDKIEGLVTATDTINKTIREAGWITTADGNTLWVKKDGIISAINQTAESVTIDASRINLNGAVSISMLGSDVKETLDAKVTADSLGKLAYKDAVEMAQLGSTIIEGGYIKADLINADLIIARTLKTNTSQYNISLDDSGLVCNSYFGIPLFRLYPAYISNTYGGALELTSMVRAVEFKVKISPHGIDFYQNDRLTKSYESV